MKDLDDSQHQDEREYLTKNRLWSLYSERKPAYTARLLIYQRKANWNRIVYEGSYPAWGSDGWENVAWLEISSNENHVRHITSQSYKNAEPDIVVPGSERLVPGPIKP
jgi:hypothetical protein